MKLFLQHREVLNIAWNRKSTVRPKIDNSELRNVTSNNKKLLFRCRLWYSTHSQWRAISGFSPMTCLANRFIGMDSLHRQQCPLNNIEENKHLSSWYLDWHGSKKGVIGSGVATYWLSKGLLSTIKVTGDPLTILVTCLPRLNTAD